MEGGHGGGRLPHVPALDGLRGVAVAVVVAFHLGRLQGGFLGVDLFFVLSGFLITSLLVAGWRADGRVRLGAFWARRARRLMPAMLLVVAAVAVYARWWADPLELRNIRADGLATLGYVANWHQLLSDADYFDSVRAPSPLLHTWSLAIEEQFYLLWPLVVGGVVALARRAGGRGTQPALNGLLAGTIAAAVASVIATIVLHGADDSPLRVYLGTDTRASALLMGAAVALLFARRSRPIRGRTARRLEVLGVLTFAGLAVATIAVDGRDGWLYEGGLALCSLAAAVAVAAVWAAPSGGISRVLSFAPLRSLGLISYGLYLWHWPVIVVLNPLRTGVEGIPLDLLRVAVSLGLAVLSYQLVEMPIRRGALPGRPAWAGALGVPVLCVVALLAATTARPTPFTREAELAAMDPSMLIVANDTPDVVVPHRAAGERLVGAAHEPGPQRILVVGDSGAYYLGKGMTAVGNRRGIALYSRGIIGCSIGRVPGTVRTDDGRIVERSPECDRVMDRWRFFLGLAQPDLVLLTLAWPGGGETDIEGQWRADCDPEHDARLQQVLTDELELLASTGARTAVTTIPYRIAPFDATAGRDETDCRNKLLRVAATATDTQVVDLAEWACPHGRCDLDRDGVDLRPDLLHFAGPGAEVAGDWVLDQLTSPG